MTRGLRNLPRTEESVEDKLQRQIDGLSEILVSRATATLRVGEVVKLTGQTADISTTTIYSVTSGGQFRVNVEHTTTTTGSGTLVTTISWTDRLGAQTFSPTNLDLTSSTRQRGTQTFYAAAGTLITYATSGTGGGAEEYALDITLERISQS